jgi:predicted aspartyl protease
MNALARSLLLILLPLTSAAGARDLNQDPAAIPQDPVEALEGTLLTLGEKDDRLTVPVAVGVKGPYNFIIDTGSERTVVSRQLAGQLNLAGGKQVTLSTMSGRSRVDTVLVPGLSIESIGDRHDIIAPALDGRDLGAVGLLGIDTLSKHKVLIDFESNTMTVRKSEKKRRVTSHADDEIVVTAKSMMGQLIVTEAFYGGTRIQVVLDTGSPVSIGNYALRERVIRRSRKTTPITMTSVVGVKVGADYTLVPDIAIGGIRFGLMPVAFAEVPPFKKFGLDKKPALLLGMDAMRSFRRVEIDFPNRQVRFLMPRQEGARLNISGGQASRLNRD